MRKILINQTAGNTPDSDLNYLDLEHLAQVEISSENPEYPIEGALAEGSETGWIIMSIGRWDASAIGVRLYPSGSVWIAGIRRRSVRWWNSARRQVKT
jgi:hypothetical protein